MKFGTSQRFNRVAKGHPPCGGCGLKYSARNLALDKAESPSLRRVWVEIDRYSILREIVDVTLLAEGVG